MATKDEIKEDAQSEGATKLATGHGRREAERMRQDTLDQKIDELSDKILLNSIDPSKMELDNEIAFVAHDASHIPNQRPDYHYCWVEWSQKNPSDHGQHVDFKLNEGWELVRKSDQEFDGLERCTTTPEGYIRWGSTVLCRVKLEVYIQIRARYLAIQKQRRGDAMNASRLLELGDKYGVKVFNHLDPFTLQRVQQRHNARKMAQASLRT